MKLNSNHIIAYLATLSSVTGAPTDPATAVTAKYDDLPRVLVTNPLRTYKGLDYTDWNLATQQSLAVGVIASQPQPNRIVTGLSPTQAFTPQSPTYSALALLQFYFGYGARSAQGAVSQPTACTVTVMGCSASTGRQMASAVFKFVPPELVSVDPVPMVRAVLPTSFNQRLRKVTFEVRNPSLVVGVVDNLGYKLFP
ncbi:MAG: hypothetical protein Q9226_002676 [Calogaya cf. arnoldii]